MKKRISILLAVALILCTACIPSASAAAANATTNTAPAPLVRVNDLIVSFPDTQPYVDVNNRTMIPVRFVTEALGAEVSWDQNAQAAVIALDGTTVKVPIGSNTITVSKDGSSSTVTMDTQAVISGDRTCIPIRFVAEALGAYVGWASYYNTVEICKEALTKDDITRLRNYGYVHFMGERYIQDSNGNLKVNPDVTQSLYGDPAISGSFLDSVSGYDNAREFLLRYKVSANIAITGKLTAKTWNLSDDKQARFYLDEAVALVNKEFSDTGITANFVSDTSCMYQDDYFSGGNYSFKGILNLTVTDQNSAAAKDVLNSLKISLVPGQVKYSIDIEAKVSWLGGNHTVAIQNVYNLSNGRR